MTRLAELHLRAWMYITAFTLHSLVSLTARRSLQRYAVILAVSATRPSSPMA